VKEAFADITFDQESLKNTWEGVTMMSSPKTSTAAMQLWFE
jgi:hypothetical protein